MKLVSLVIFINGIATGMKELILVSIIQNSDIKQTV